ncbi:MAG: LytTR family DNA-binding domain-containing protein [Spirosomataceae bacterium]
MKTKCLLVDDEPIALDVMEEHLRHVEDFQIVGKCRTAIEAFSYLQNKPVDLLFLDIHMPQMTGLELLRTLPQKPKVIFTTAYREYAVEGFELDAVDYMVKPVSPERLFKAISRYYQRNNLVGQVPAPPASISTEDPHIFVKEDRRLVKILLNDILYLESLRDYLRIRTSQKQVITKQTISYYEERLADDQFIRIHRSFIVSGSKVESLTESSVELTGGHSLPIGKSYKQLVFDKLNLKARH